MWRVKCRAACDVTPVCVLRSTYKTPLLPSTTIIRSPIAYQWGNQILPYQSSYQINAPASLGRLPWLITTIKCLIITGIGQDISILYFCIVHLCEMCMISSSCSPKLYSALFTKWKMLVSWRVHKIFRIREILMNPESILYKACILVNASWSWRLRRLLLFAFVRYIFLYGGRDFMVNKLLR